MPQLEAAAAVPCKKRTSLDLPQQASQDALNKKLRRNSCDGTAGSTKGKQQQQASNQVPPVMSAGMTAGMVNNLQLSQSAAWNYPSTYPMGMMPHMPLCFPSPFFNPFMFPNMWMPGMAGCAMPPGSMAPGMMPPGMHMGQGAGMMPAASTSMMQAAFSGGMPAAMPMYPTMQTAMSCPLPSSMPMCMPMACPPAATAPQASASTSNASSCGAVPFTAQSSPANSSIAMPKPAAPCISTASACSVQMAAGSPPPMASSPLSVANNSVGSACSQDTSGDQEFASFIDSFLNASNESFSEAFAESFNLHSPDITSSGDFTDFALPASTFDMCCTSELEQPLGLKLSRSDSLLNLLDQEFIGGEACAAC